MKYIEKFLIIAVISFLGELLNYIIPLPVPGSIYGFLILFILLVLKVIKVDEIRPVTDFLLSIMPITFIGPGVGLIVSAGELKSMAIPALISITAGTAVILSIVSLVVEMVLKRDSKSKKPKQKTK
ncbi:MAG: CidA/LrgA family protein [Clostridia bacterium]|nr:CidA/LrgA family protein [Clostridia bacterium]